MPSKRRSARRKRRSKKVWTPPTDWSPWVWGVLGLNVLVGLAFSPATALTTLRVEGAPAYDRGRISQFARALEGRPLLRVDRQRVLSFSLGNQAVERAEYRQNLFGRGVLVLTYRRAVAKVEGPEGLYLSSGGTVFPSPLALKVPIVVVPPTVPGRNLAVFGAWRSGTAALMCDNVAGRLPDRKWRLIVSRTGFVSLVPERGATIEFGSFEDLDKKFKALDGALKDEPGLLDKVSKVIVSSPMKPQFVP